MLKLFLLIASINGFLSVAIGAFGAHGLEGKISERMLANYHTGVNYQMFHTVGLLGVAFLSTFVSTPMLVWAGSLMTAGIVFFSGSLYVMALTGKTILGAVTPIGGVLFLAGWVLLGLAALKLS
ncbi:DUF423 domain-containing protein [Aureibacillus halotolerans]|uniref:Uncharacterized membrane protein YgdD (TMEM256/DUF423 family) n=1 Tax=Aureibacillus halotolerans TaxID=1508390 RepID=A0A4R6U312_9BACI|nr:DUF423 domain-containing protein [Aureibacillus halotolerans]TDQ38785.1 uncharacterized membrane protein YgdD (TMEM256/DUF423 family) [Aureibacillus halotolerans]